MDYGYPVRSDPPRRRIPFGAQPPRTSVPLREEPRKSGEGIDRAITGFEGAGGDLAEGASISPIGTLVNRLYAKVLSADPDTYDSIIDGLTWIKRWHLMPVIRANISSATGQVDIRLEGDIDTTNWRYAVSTSAMPSDATVDAATLQTGQNLAFTNVATLALGDVLYVKAKAIGVLSASQYAQATIRRDTSAPTKTILLPPAAFFPWDETTKWIYNGDYLAPNVTGAMQEYVAMVVLPKGVTITSVVIKTTRAATDAIFLQFMRGQTQLGSANPGSGSVETTFSLNELVDDGVYWAYAQLTANVSITSCYVQWMKITYTVPSYEKTY